MKDSNRPPDDFLETLVDMREYDVPYVIRVAIDLDLRVGAWYKVAPEADGVQLQWQKDMIRKVGQSPWRVQLFMQGVGRQCQGRQTGVHPPLGPFPTV